MDTGVRSRQLKGTTWASGVVNRFESVMTILCGLPASALTSRKPSAPAPPALLTTRMGCLISLFFATAAWMKRAIWSAPPPGPAGTTSSTGLVGSHGAAMAEEAEARPAASASRVRRTAMQAA
jgi:hypothetical protein